MCAAFTSANTSACKAGMKQGLSLRVSQHLALTPQLQQSIRLLQLSTLEMAQEVEQMLDENPFLERDTETAEREEFGLAQADASPSLGDQVSEWASADTAPAGSTDAVSDTPSSSEALEEAAPLEQNWEGDGSVEFTPDDSEWGGDAPPRNGARDDEDEVSAADLASEHITLPAHLHEQALALRLNDDERAALYFLIESLDEDGYLIETLAELAEAILAQEEQARRRTMHGDERLARLEELRQLLQTALHWLHNMEPAGVGARDLAECLKLQILELRNTPEARARCPSANSRWS